MGDVEQAELLLLVHVLSQADPGEAGGVKLLAIAGMGCSWLGS